MSDFRGDGEAALDWVAGYLERVGDLPVASSVSPGDVRAKLAPSSVVPPPTMTKYCGTARDPRRRTLPWKPIVAMWCWPQPLGHPLILMRAPSAAAMRSGFARR